MFSSSTYHGQCSSQGLGMRMRTLVEAHQVATICNTAARGGQPPLPWNMIFLKYFSSSSLGLKSVQRELEHNAEDLKHLAVTGYQCTQL